MISIAGVLEIHTRPTRYVTDRSLQTKGMRYNLLLRRFVTECCLQNRATSAIVLRVPSEIWALCLQKRVSVVSTAKESGSRGQRLGYIRVSTVEQNSQRQKENGDYSVGLATSAIDDLYSA